MVTSADALHEARGAYRLFICQVGQLRDIDARCARRGRRDGEALAHGRESRARKSTLGGELPQRVVGTTIEGGHIDLV